MASYLNVGSDNHNKKKAVLSKTLDKTTMLLPPASGSSTVVIGSGAIVNFVINNPDRNRKLSFSDVFFRYKFSNQSGVNIAIPIYGIWSVLDFMKVYIDGALVCNLDQRMLKYYFIRRAHDYESVNKFINATYGTNLFAPTTALNGTKVITAGITETSFRRSYIGEVLPDLFKNRTNQYFGRIEIQLAFIASQDNTLDSYYLGLGDGATLNNVQITNLVLSADITEFPNNHVYFNDSRPLQIVIPNLQRKQYIMTSNVLQTVSVNLNQDFSTASSMGRLYVFVSNSTLAGTTNLSNTNNMSVLPLVSFELLRNGTRYHILESPSELFSYFLKHKSQRGHDVFDGPVSAAVALYSMSWYYSFNQDSYRQDTNTTSLSTLTNNNSGGVWVANITVDLTGYTAGFNVLNLVLESNRILTLNTQGKPPSIVA